MIRQFFFTTFVGCALALSSLAGAQAGGDGGGAGGGGRPGGRGGFDPAQMRERMMNGMKEQMGATEDEWKVIQPKLEKVMTVQREARFGGFGFGRGGRGGDGNAEQPQSALAKAAAELRTTLANKEATAEDILAKLKALREAKEKAHADLVAAQKELKEVLSQRQEASLVLSGMLD